MNLEIEEELKLLRKIHNYIFKVSTLLLVNECRMEMGQEKKTTSKGFMSNPVLDKLASEKKG